MIQTYEPAGPGMIICSSGGKYILVADHLAALKSSIDNGDKIMAELKIAVEKCIEQDKQIAALTAELVIYKEDLAFTEKRRQYLMEENSKKITLLAFLSTANAKQAEEIERLRNKIGEVRRGISGRSFTEHRAYMPHEGGQ